MAELQPWADMFVEFNECQRWIEQLTNAWSNCSLQGIQSHIESRIFFCNIPPVPEFVYSRESIDFHIKLLFGNADKQIKFYPGPAYIRTFVICSDGFPHTQQISYYTFFFCRLFIIPFIIVFCARCTCQLGAFAYIRNKQDKIVDPITLFVRCAVVCPLFDYKRPNS